MKKILVIGAIVSTSALFGVSIYNYYNINKINESIDVMSSKVFEGSDYKLTKGLSSVGIFNTYRELVIETKDGKGKIIASYNINSGFLTIPAKQPKVLGNLKTIGQFGEYTLSTKQGKELALFEVSSDNENIYFNLISKQLNIDVNNELGQSEIRTEPVNINAILNIGTNNLKFNLNSDSLKTMSKNSEMILNGFELDYLTNIEESKKTSLLIGEYILKIKNIQVSSGAQLNGTHLELKSYLNNANNKYNNDINLSVNKFIYDNQNEAVSLSSSISFNDIDTNLINKSNKMEDSNLFLEIIKKGLTINLKQFRIENSLGFIDLKTRIIILPEGKAVFHLAQYSKINSSITIGGIYVKPAGIFLNSLFDFKTPVVNNRYTINASYGDYVVNINGQPASDKINNIVLDYLDKISAALGGEPMGE